MGSCRHDPELGYPGPGLATPVLRPNQAAIGPAPRLEMRIAGRIPGRIRNVPTLQRPKQGRNRSGQGGALIQGGSPTATWREPTLAFRRISVDDVGAGQMMENAPSPGRPEQNCFLYSVFGPILPKTYVDPPHRFVVPAAGLYIHIVDRHVRTGRRSWPSGGGFATRQFRPQRLLVPLIANIPGITMTRHVHGSLRAALGWSLRLELGQWKTQVVRSISRLVNRQQLCFGRVSFLRLV